MNQQTTDSVIGEDVKIGNLWVFEVGEGLVFRYNEGPGAFRSVAIGCKHSKALEILNMLKNSKEN